MNKMILVFVTLMVALVNAGCSNDAEQASTEETSQESVEGLHDLGGGSWSYVYTLPADVNLLYPDASWLPPAYAPCFSSLGKTITTFTLASATNSHLDNPTVKVTPTSHGDWQVTLGSTDKSQLQTFSQRHQDFLTVSRQALAGIDYCKGDKDCWKSETVSGNGECQTDEDVWAMFVAWAVAFDGYNSVNLMDYPPNSNMQNASSTNNVTMHRWNNVLETVGVPKTELGDYEVIVNTRPIAAPGAGDSTQLPQSVDAKEVFGTKGRDWIGQGLEYFTDPPSNQSPSALPILVLGSPARRTWAEIIGYTGSKVSTTCQYSSADEVPVLGYGEFKQSKSSKTGWWLASNHPDETMYNCCPGDTSGHCKGSTNLVACDKVDLTAACMQYAFGQQPDAIGAEVFQSCNDTWNTAEPTPEIATKICINARMSYNFNSKGLCECEDAAAAFCTANNSNACNTNDSSEALMCTQYNDRYCNDDPDSGDG
jgi:hypothetical protein